MCADSMKSDNKRNCELVRNNRKIIDSTIWDLMMELHKEKDQS